MTPEQRARLPKYALDEISRLERRVAEAEEVAADVAATDAVVWANPYAKPSARPVARQGERVRFCLDGLDGHRWYDVHAKDGALEVMASTGLAVVPQVTNVVRLALVR